MAAHEDVLRQHQLKMDMHRKWMQEQHNALRSGSLGAAIPTTTTASSAAAHHDYPSDARSDAQYSSVLYASAKSTVGGGSSPAYNSPLPKQQHQASHKAGQSNGRAYSNVNAGGAGDSSPPLFGSPTANTRQPFSLCRRSVPSDHPADVVYNDDHFVMVNTGSPLAVFMRGTQWTMRRAQRLEEQRVAREQEELAECTFAPTASHGAASSPGRDERSSQYSASRARPGVPITEVASGVQVHLERQEKARRTAREKEERLMSAGTKWTPELTTVEPFHLGQRTPNNSIKSLAQPIQAPHRSMLELSNVYQPYNTSYNAQPEVAHGVEHRTGIPPPGHFSYKGGASKGVVRRGE